MLWRKPALEIVNSWRFGSYNTSSAVKGLVSVDPTITLQKLVCIFSLVFLPFMVKVVYVFLFYLLYILPDT